MTVITLTRFTADSAAQAELLVRHAALVSVTRSAGHGPTETRLGRLDERTWLAIWRWDSAEQLAAARGIAPGRPESAAAFALAEDVTVEQIEVVDEQ
ncbi:hypothetical protein CS0771_49000 [Catellatospora sp. IY07-71]|uniref:hypothetical protein n=1 Tax=Catellatospora sp. IY07-71 TaxID=2728827 RepID=UPI001BB34B12|nr:hypothetical protein [Catellatospora sp. IY07-71]BCJ75356.1 hypothetical protein CS0771_49000 [Catellatospora sp. IY07-71]